jgi:C4-type Zn-finger protein
MGEKQGDSPTEHEEIMCERCNVVMFERAEKLEIPFHGEDLWHYYECPVCKIRYE